MNNVYEIELPVRRDTDFGSLVPIEMLDNIPFEAKRIYYIFGVPEGIRRGFHSHRDLQQVLICVHGRVTIQTKILDESEDVVLDDPTKGLFIGPMIWREMYDFSKDAVLLVLASEHYNEKDYIRDFEEYLVEATTYFANDRREMESKLI